MNTDNLSPQPRQTPQGTMVLPLERWPVVRIIHAPPHSSIESAAAGEALLRYAREPVIAIVREFTEPRISIGYFQSWKDVPAGRAFVRRATGGSLVDPEKGFSISTMVPPEHPRYWMDRIEKNVTFNGAIGQALRNLGAPVEMAVNAEDFDPETSTTFGDCFQETYRFDLTNSTTKLAASAVHRSPNGSMQEARIHVPDVDQEKLIAEVITEMVPLFGLQEEISKLSPMEEILRDELIKNRYGTDEWNKMR
jgi:lipoate-protein ligase A